MHGGRPQRSVGLGHPLMRALAKTVLNRRVGVVQLSMQDLGHQPFVLASPAR